MKQIVASLLFVCSIAWKEMQMKSIFTLVLLSSFALAGDKPKEPKPVSVETKLAIRELQLEQRELDVRAMQAILPIQERLAIIRQALAEKQKQAFEECHVDNTQYDFDDQNLSCKLKPPPPPPVMTMDEKRKQEEKEKEKK